MKQKVETTVLHSDDGLKKATVWYNGNEWGCSFFVNNSYVDSRIFPGHSENYAFDAAENYVLGILTVNHPE